MKLNLNDLAELVTKIEGGKVNLPIGQVKEVLRITLGFLSTLTVSEAGELLKKYQTVTMGTVNFEIRTATKKDLKNNKNLLEVSVVKVPKKSSGKK